MIKLKLEAYKSHDNASDKGKNTEHIIIRKSGTKTTLPDFFKETTVYDFVKYS